MATAGVIACYLLFVFAFYYDGEGVSDARRPRYLRALVLMFLATLLSGFGAAEAWKRARRRGSNRKLMVLGTASLMLLAAGLIVFYAGRPRP